MHNLHNDVFATMYERAEELQHPKDIYNDIWANLALFYSNGHFNTTLLLIFPRTIDTIDLQASHLSPNFPKDIASAIQNFRLDRPEMEGFAVAHEVQLEKNNENKFQLFVGEVSNGIVLFFRHRDIEELKIRVAFAQIGRPEFRIYPPTEIAASQEGIVSTLSFDLNSLQQ